MVQLDIFPIPRKIKIEKLSQNLVDHTWIVIPQKASESLIFHLSEFQQFLLLNYNHKTEISKCLPAKGKPFLKLITKTEKIKCVDSYELNIDANGITISAKHDCGFYYGLTSLKQIIKQFCLCLPHLRISDYPDFPQRGVMLDVSRCKVPTLNTIKGIIRQFAELRINHLQLYIEHTFAFNAHETVWANSSPFTSSDIIELDSYCRKYFIELVPNLNSFGHFERWLVHPEYRKYAECPDGFISPFDQKLKKPAVLKPNQQSLDFIADLYKEYLPNFTSSYFNVGCDETIELGKGYSKEQANKIGVNRVYLNHLKEIGKLCQKNNKTMMFWGDIILNEPELISELPENSIALNWGYEADQDFPRTCAAFADAGIQFFVAPGTSSWGSLLGKSEKCIANIKNAAENGLKHGAIGILNTDWGDDGHHQTLPISYLGFSAGALYAWNGGNVEKDHIIKATNAVFIQEKDTALTESIYDLGNIYRHIQKLQSNHTAINDMLFDTSDTNESLDAVKVEELEKISAELETVSQKLKLSAFITPNTNGALIKEEIQLNIQMANIAVKWGLSVLNNNQDMSHVVILLKKVIGQHEKIWLQRNREGGLYESSEWLRKKLKMLQA